MRKCITTGAVLAVLGGSALGIAPAAQAGPAPQPVPGGVKVTKAKASLPGMKSLKHAAGRRARHVASVDSVRYDSVSWTANVRIDRGSNGAWTKCSDGSLHYGPRVGPGYWRFGGNCSGYGNLVDFGTYGD
ncbi:hypothetical protein [Actinomadura macrotermitis]|uniref:Uncharacterized protein n=1 Tax=Actinomadura macrotermitis TaxID=2585200 RepID=A0A7K0BZI2_9ACTN|nr:hypothetical protein [Actinomadura macrotermitis]MQY06496.1 hypothetical protein [Actinomadura macrotermitis]